MEQSKYDAYLVDLDGTLYRPKPVKWVMALELMFFGAFSVRTLQTFRRHHELLREAEHSSNSPFHHQLEATAAALKIPIERVEAVVLQWMFERPLKWLPRFARRSLVAELAALHAEGAKLALVSDYPARRKLEAVAPGLRFDVVVANGEEGGPQRLKPCPDGYLLAAERLGVQPDRCLVIGDRKDADGLAAKRAGMAFRLVS